MKKSIIIVLIAILLITGLVILTGCTNNEVDNENVNNINTGAKVDLKFNFEHMNGKVYNTLFNISRDDRVVEFDEVEPNYVRIENEKENYGIELTLDTEAKEAYKQFQTTAKENSELYEEVKFAKFNGYFSKTDDEIYGYILLDESDSTFNAFVMFNIYLVDENSENNDIQTIYKSSNIQNILKSVTFKS